MNSDDIKRKVIIDLIVSPLSAGPFTAGASLMMISWAFGFGAFWSFVGFVGMIAGLGAVANNFLFNLDKVNKKAVEALIKQKQQALENELDELDALLVEAKGVQPDRDQTHLRDLRALYADYLQDTKDGKISEFTPVETASQIKNLFDTCVSSLRKSSDLWIKAVASKGKRKQEILAEREEVIEDVGQGVEQLAQAIEVIRSLGHKPTKTALDKMRQQLNDSLEIAKRTKERMSAFNVDVAGEYE